MLNLRKGNLLELWGNIFLCFKTLKRENLSVVSFWYTNLNIITKQTNGILPYIFNTNRTVKSKKKIRIQYSKLAHREPSIFIKNLILLWKKNTIRKKQQPKTIFFWSMTAKYISSELCAFFKVPFHTHFRPQKSKQSTLRNRTNRAANAFFPQTFADEYMTACIASMYESEKMKKIHIAFWFTDSFWSARCFMSFIQRLKD